MLIFSIASYFFILMKVLYENMLIPPEFYLTIILLANYEVSSYCVKHQPPLLM